MNNNPILYKIKCKLHQPMWLLFFSFSIVLFYATFVSQIAIAQNLQSPESLKSNNTSNISAQLALADKNKRLNPKLFKQILTKLSQHKSVFSLQQKNYFNLLNTYYLTYISEYDKAKVQLEALLQSTPDELIKFRANYTLVNVSSATKNWGDGLNYVATTIKSLPKIKNTEHYQNGLISIIIFYNLIKQYPLALLYIDKLAEQRLTSINECILVQQSLEAKFNLNQLNSKDVAINDALHTCLNAKFNIATNIIRVYQAKLYLAEQKPKVSLDILLPHIDEVKGTHYPMLVALTSSTIANTYYQLNDFEKANAYAKESLKANKSDSIIQLAADSYSLLYKTAKQQQNFRLALEYHEKHSELDKADLEGEKTKHIAFQLAQHQAYEQETQIKLLNEKNALLTAKQSLAESEVANTQLIITVLTVGIALLILWAARLYKIHKRIKELAEYDALTGVYNRGHFTHVTNSALKYCKNAQQDLSVIMFDLDHFKKVNDSFGHACGDWALKETIKVCQNIGRKDDIFARLGGEEFCLVLTNCTIDVAMLRAEACRAAIEAIITEESRCDFLITASFGVTDVKRSGFDLDKLLADADFAAYTSKNAGRNRVTMFEEPQKGKAKKLDSSWNYN